MVCCVALYRMDVVLNLVAKLAGGGPVECYKVPTNAHALPLGACHRDCSNAWQHCASRFRENDDRRRKGLYHAGHPTAGSRTGTLISRVRRTGTPQHVLSRSEITCAATAADRIGYASPAPAVGVDVAAIHWRLAGYHDVSSLGMALRRRHDHRRKSSTIALIREGGTRAA